MVGIYSNETYRLDHLWCKFCTVGTVYHRRVTGDDYNSINLNKDFNMKIYTVSEAGVKAKRWTPPNRQIQYPSLDVGQSFIMYRDKRKSANESLKTLQQGAYNYRVRRPGEYVANTVTLTAPGNQAEFWINEKAVVVTRIK
jgi:hypothetical protein